MNEIDMAKTDLKNKLFEKAVTAIRQGDQKALESLLKKNESLVHSQDSEGQYGLIHYLALPESDSDSAHNKNDLDSQKASTLLETLVNHGADINTKAQSPANITVLELSAQYNLLPLTQKCLDLGAKLESPLVKTALDNGSTEIAKLLVKEGASVDVEVAAGIGDIDALAAHFDNSHNLRISEEVLIDFGTMAMTKALVKPFVVACKNGQMESAFFLIRKGADLNLFILEDDDTVTEASGLHWAARYGHYDLVKFLINYGAKIYAKDTKENKTPSQWAESAGQEKISQYIRFLERS